MGEKDPLKIVWGVEYKLYIIKCDEGMNKETCRLTDRQGQILVQKKRKKISKYE